MYKIANLDVLDKQNHKGATEIDIGFAVKAILTTLAKSKAVNERGVLEFRMDCTKFISHVPSKILERSPMKYKLVRGLYCLNPQKMIGFPDACSKAFEIALKKLIEARWRYNTAADELMEQYKCFLQFVKKDYKFEFRNCMERVDVFLYAHINDKKEFQSLWSVFKLLLTLCHSQSMVERGFGVTNDVVTPNLRNETLVSLRTVCDAVNCMNISLQTL